MKEKPICYHNFLVPTDWNQPKPEPCEMITCECGKNAGCPVCGWGWGQYPCDCGKKDVDEQAIDQVLDRHSDAWKELAK